MKKALLCIFALVITFTIFAFIGCSKGSDKDNDNKNEVTVTEYTVTYFDGEEILYSTKCKQNEYAPVYTPADKADRKFVCWHLNGAEYAFDIPVTSDLNLYAVWEDISGNPSVPDKPDDNKGENKPIILTVNYYYNEEILYKKQVEHGKQAEYTELESSADYAFTGWQYNGNSYDFSEAVTQDIDLYATFTAVEHTVEFTDGEEIIAVCTFTAENRQIDVPEVPLKPHYTGEWEEFVLESQDIKVNAVYTPINYTVTFLADGKTVAEITYNAENKDFSDPQIPQKQGYTCKWENYLFFENVTVNAIYKPIEYTVEFVADGVQCATAVYTVENKEIKIPDVPEKYGYTGEWAKFELTLGNFTVKAVYTPVEYTVEFIADGVLCATAVYTLENTQIVNPTVPEKYGYRGSWEDFKLTGGNIKVNAVYSAIRYTVEFFADGGKVFEQTYTLENTEIKIPEVPEKFGYKGSWEDFKLTGGNVEINAIYTPVRYAVEFIADGVKISEQTYTLENVDIITPSIPEKYGYTCAWEDFALTGGDIKVNAVYIPIEYTVSFCVDGVIISVQTYTLENMNIPIPAVPKKDGCTGKWEAFTLDGGDIIVTASYSYLYRTVKFYADGKLVHTTTYTYADTSIDLPPVPAKKGYEGKWENFTLSGEDLTVKAVYSLVDYLILFYADGVCIKTVKYTVNTKNITVPAVPEKEGYTGEWEKFELDCTDRIVKAIYTKKSQEEPKPPVVEDKPQEDNGNLVCETTENGLVIAKYNGAVGNLYIPAEIGGEKVYGLGKNAFKDNQTLKQITIGEGIEIMEAGCFQNCANLQKVVIADTVKEIGTSAFDSCISLAQIDLGNGLLNIKKGAFTNCIALEEIIIPDSVETIASSAFRNCTNLKTVTIGQSVKQIGAFAFTDTALTYAVFKNVEGWSYAADYPDAAKCAEILKNGTALTRS